MATKSITIREKERTAVNITETKTANNQEMTVFDFMVPIIGEQFRTNPILNKRLFSNQPVHAPFILTVDAYTIETKNQLKSGNTTAALEAYKFVIDAQTGFRSLISSIQDNALLTNDEKRYLKFANTPLSKSLSRVLRNSGAKVDDKAYSEWLDKIRGMYNEYLKLARYSFGTEEHSKICKELGKGTEQEAILDTKFLRTYIKENYPESTIGMLRY